MTSSNSSNSTGRPEKQDGWLNREDNSRLYDYRRAPSPREQRREDTLAAWLGPERRQAVFADLRPAPRRADALVDALIEKLPRGDIFLLNQIRQDWAGIVGAVNARQTRPVFIKDGQLVIEVANPTWRYVMERQQKGLLLQKISAYSRNRITDLRFTPPGHSY